MRVPLTIGDIVQSEPKLIQKVPVYLRVSRIKHPKKYSRSNLQIEAVPVRLTQSSIRMRSKVTIYHKGSKIMKEAQNYKIKEYYSDEDSIMLDDKVVEDEIEVLIENITFKFVENQGFEMLQFDVKKPTESSFDYTKYEGQQELSIGNLSSRKKLQNLEFYVELQMNIYEKGFKRYSLFLNAPKCLVLDLSDYSVDCAVFVECLVDGAPFAGSKLVQVYNIKTLRAQFPIHSYINFDPDCTKVKITIIFHQIGYLQLSKTAENIRTEISKILKSS